MAEKGSAKRTSARAVADKAPAAAKTTAASPAKTVAKSAASAGRAVGKTGIRLAKPLVQSVKKEDNRTLAKMLMAAAMPRLINVGLRFAVRNPVLAALGVLAVAVTIGASQDDEPA